MKIYYLFLISLCLLLTSCTLPPEYIGDKFSRTNSIAVFYSANEVNKPYKVIGHFVIHKYRKTDVEKGLVYGAKKIGADGVIILGAEAGQPNRIGADAIKYN